MPTKHASMKKNTKLSRQLDKLQAFHKKVPKRKFVVALDHTVPDGLLTQHSITLDEKLNTDYVKMQEDTAPELRSFLKKQLKTRGAIKVYIVATSMLHSESKRSTEEFFHRSNQQTITNDYQLTKAVQHMLADLDAAIAGVSQGASDWYFVHGVKLEIFTATYKPNRGRGHQDLPNWLANKKACINPQNTEDDMCFLWCLLIWKYQAKVR